MTDDEPFERLTKRDIPEFGKSTADLLMHIVNNCGVRWRAIDGGHMILFPPDKESRPFKVAAKRTAQENNRILRRQFMEAFGLPSPEEYKRAQREEKRAAAEAATEVEEQPMSTAVEEPVVETAEHHPEDVLRALAIVASYLGTPVDGETVDALEEEVADLNRQVTFLTGRIQAIERERDEYKAKLALLRETFAGLED